MSGNENANGINEVIQSREMVIGMLEKVFSDLQASVERTNLVAEIDKAILNSTFSSEEVFKVIVQECLSKTGCKHGQVVLFRRNKLHVVASSDESRLGVELPLTGSLCGQAIVNRATQRCEDVKKLPNGSYVPFHDETRGELAMLIKLEHSGRILGVLNLEREKVGDFDASAVTFAEILAGQAAIAIDHSETWSSIKMLYETSTSLLSGNLTLAQSFQKILASILESLDLEYGQIVRLLGDEFVILASSRPEDTGLRFGKDSVCGQHILQEGSQQILVIHNIQESPYRDFYLGLPQPRDQQMRSELVVPLVDSSNRVVGALNIESTRVGMFSALDQHLVGVIGSLIANAISAALSRRKILNRARTDAANVALTQLGTVAQTFLHGFANSVGSARAKLIELKDRLPSEAIPSLRQGTRPVDFVQTIIADVDVAKETILEFQDRFNPNHNKFQAKALNLELVARQAMENIQRRNAERPIIFSYESQVPSGGTHNAREVRGEPECWLSPQISEVIENLLNNSVEAIAERGPDFDGGVVQVTVDMPDAFHARLRVEDNGAGVLEKDLPRIFEFAFTTKNRRELGGFGLWFCQWYVMMRGGKITCDSKPGERTTFEVILPTLIADGEELFTDDAGGVK